MELESMYTDVQISRILEVVVHASHWRCMKNGSCCTRWNPSIADVHWLLQHALMSHVQSYWH